MIRNLYLIPATLGDSDIHWVLPQKTIEMIRTLDHFVVENERSARRFLIKTGYNKPISSVNFYILDVHTKPENIPSIFKMSGTADLGLLSEAGAPAVADPGAGLVYEAHRQNIRVVPLSGPSSILLAIMASGLNGQHFIFHGYLPVKDAERDRKIKLIEKKSGQENQAQIFIETPYRNNKLIKALLENCKPETKLCIAANITLESELIQTRTISQWATNVPDLHKQPAVFVLQA